MKTADQSFLQKPLRVHTFLADVPLHDLWVMQLPGGGEGRTLAELLERFTFDDFEGANPIVAGLFKLRWMLGRWLGWDDKRHDPPAASYLNRLTSADREKSLLEPGSPDGPFRLLYRFQDESLSELINGTVHAFTLTALESTVGGYTLYLAIYVKQVSRFTPLYMALIDPFRKWFIYPAIIRKIERDWKQAYA